MKETLKCVITDDNEMDRIILTNYLSNYPEIEIIGVFENPILAHKSIEKLSPDIVFLDVDMPRMSGLELRKRIAQIPICIFTTDHPEYAVVSFELETLDYLLKPHDLERFIQTIDRINEFVSIRKKAIQHETQQNEDKVFFIKEGHKKVRVVIDDILYLNALQNYTILITTTTKHYVLSTIGALLKETYFHSFIRVHRSYAIQKKHVISINSKEIVLIEGIKIPLGRSYKDQIDLLF